MDTVEETGTFLTEDDTRVSDSEDESITGASLVTGTTGLLTLTRGDDERHHTRYNRYTNDADDVQDDVRPNLKTKDKTRRHHHGRHTGSELKETSETDALLLGLLAAKQQPDTSPKQHHVHVRALPSLTSGMKDSHWSALRISVSGTGADVLAKYVDATTGLLKLPIPAKYLSSVLSGNPYNDPESVTKEKTHDLKNFVIVAINKIETSNNLGRVVSVSSEEKDLNTRAVIESNEEYPKKEMTSVGLGEIAFPKGGQNIYALPSDYVDHENFKSFFGRSAKPTESGIVLIPGDKNAAFKGRDVISIRHSDDTYNNPLSDFVLSRIAKDAIVNTRATVDGVLSDIFFKDEFQVVAREYYKIVKKVPMMDPKVALQLYLSSPDGFKYLANLPVVNFSITLNVRWISTVINTSQPVQVVVEEAELATRAKRVSDAELIKARTNDFLNSL